MTDKAKTVDYIDNIVRFSVLADEASKSGKIEVKNKYQKKIYNTYIELGKDPNLFHDVISVLLNHELPFVRTGAAVHAYKADYERNKCIEVLKEIADHGNYGVCSLEAHLFLKFTAKIGTTKEQNNETTNEDTHTIRKHTLILNHIELYLGAVDKVYHEIISDQLHIDILYIKPNTKRNVHTFVTCGMSDMAMKTPKNFEANQYCELMISLPPNWELNPDFEHENNWPIKVLKQIARMPYEQDSWIGVGHTIQNGNPEIPYPGNSELSSMLVAYPISVPGTDKFIKLDLDKHKSVHFYCLIPITKNEADLVRKNGIDALLDDFDRYKLKDIVINRRKSFLNAKRAIRAMKIKMILAFILGLSVVSLLAGLLFALGMSTIDRFDWTLVQYGVLFCFGLVLILMIVILLSENGIKGFANMLFMKTLVEAAPKKAKVNINPSNAFRPLNPEVTTSDSLRLWITDILENEKISSEIVALNFGYFESEKGHIVYCTGSKIYDKVDSDWAGDMDFVPKQKYFTPEDSIRKLDWATFATTMDSMIVTILTANISKIPESICHITSGFDEGDLTLIWSRVC